MLDGSGVGKEKMRGFGMEGRISRKPTQTVTDRAWTAITSEGG
jgi:hypothetical protein